MTRTPQIDAIPGTAPMGFKPPTPAKIVRKWSAIGPCLTLGRLTKETPEFYIFDKWCGGDKYEGRSSARKPRPGRYSRHHVEPCRSCRDHPQTQYPNGYMD